MNAYRAWVVENESHGMRLDVFLQKMGPERSRSEWARLIEEGCVLVNAKTEAQRSHRLTAADEVVFDQQQKELAPKTTPSPITYTPPEILFEDEFLLIVNKPEGLAVHGGNGIPFEKTLAHWVLHKKYLSTNDAWPQDVVEGERWGIVHRLDMGTSGAMVVAKSASIHRALAKMFEARTVHRRYFAAATGTPHGLAKKIPPLLEKWCREGKAAFRMSGSKFSLATQYARDPTHPLRMSPVPDGGRRAISHALIHSEANPHALLELKLQTGRTHQIRSHLRFLNCPVVGDELYGGQKWHRVLLHSHIIKFSHPETQKPVVSHAPSPTFFEASLQLGLRVPTTTDEFWEE